MGSKIDRFGKECNKYGKEIFAGFAVAMIPLVKYVAGRLMDHWLGERRFFDPDRDPYDRYSRGRSFDPDRDLYDRSSGGRFFDPDRDLCDRSSRGRSFDSDCGREERCSRRGGASRF